jgi:hypothetical protein
MYEHLARVWLASKMFALMRTLRERTIVYYGYSTGFDMMRYTLTSPPAHLLRGYGVYISPSRLAGRGLPSSPGPFSQAWEKGRKLKQRSCFPLAHPWERGIEGVRARSVYAVASARRGEIEFENRR